MPQFPSDQPGVSYYPQRSCWGDGGAGDTDSVNLKGPHDPPASPSSSWTLRAWRSASPSPPGLSPLSCILNVHHLPSPLQPFPTGLWLPVGRSWALFFLVFPVVLIASQTLQNCPLNSLLKSPRSFQSPPLLPPTV